MKLECLHADTCLSDYWGGHHLPHVCVPVDRNTTLADLKSALRSEINQGAVAGKYDEADDAWHRKAIAAINRITKKVPRERLFKDIPASEDEDGESVYAFFVFTEIAPERPSPSIKRLLRVTDDDVELARKVRDVIRSGIPISSRMDQINRLLDGHGVEAVFEDGAGWPWLEYVNMGDTYIDTVTCRRGRFHVECLGDIFE